MNHRDHDTLINRLLAVGFDVSRASARAVVLGQAAALLNGLTHRETTKAFAFLVPGRVEFLGKHTDYAGGRSLLCAVDRGFGAMAFPRNDGIVRIANPPGGAPIVFPLDPELKVATGHWSNYAMTVARRIARNFPGLLRGADIAFASDLPPSAGMSSSSALMIAIFLVLAKVNRLHESPVYREHIKSDEDLAGYLGTIENGQTFRGLSGDLGVGTFGGSQDHTAILCSRPGVLRQYAFCPVRHERDIPFPDGYILAIASSGVIAEKTGGARDAYNAISMSVTKILHLWRHKTGRADATLADAIHSAPGALGALRVMLRAVDSESNSNSQGRLLDRLEQFIAESDEMIPAAATALASRRIDELGLLIDRSQQLSERQLRNQVPETIFLAKAARECGAAAASAFGAGFGGSVWALVRMDDAERFLDAWSKEYASRFPEPAARATFFLTSAGTPAQEIA